MIKKYNQFINEELVMGAEPRPTTAPTPTTTPDTPTIPRPTRPGITPTEIPSEEDAPLAKVELPEEEGSEYIGQKMIADLANELGVNIEPDGSINYEGQKINFYSETEKFHIGKQKFDSVESVLNYLHGDSGLEKEMPSQDLSDIDEDEFEKGDYPFESKSYKSSRLKKFNG